MDLLKKTDIEILQEGFDEDSVKNTEEYKKGYYSGQIEQYIISDDSCLYKGPDEKYGQIDGGYCLPEGIIINSDFHDDYWMKVNYEGHVGWIYHYNLVSESTRAKTANIAQNSNIFNTQETVILREKPYDDAQISASFSLPQLSQLPVLYKFGFYHDWYYVQYGQYSGWFQDDGSEYLFANRQEQPFRIKTIKDIALRQYAGSDPGSEIVPAGTELTVLYDSGNGEIKGAYKARYYVENNGSSIKGWIDDNEFATRVIDNRTTQLEYEQPVYSDVDGKETGKIIPAGTYYILYYYVQYSDENKQGVTWYYIRNNSSYEEIGWIKTMSNEEIQELESQKKKEQEEKEKEIEEAERLEEERQRTLEKLANDKKKKEKEHESTEQTFIWLIIAFGILSMSIIIALALTKKHRKSKEEDQDEDNKNPEKNSEDSELESKEKTVENEPKSEEIEEEDELKSEELDDEIVQNSEDVTENIKQNREKKRRRRSRKRRRQKRRK